jgi:hypothetical protein
MLTYKEGHNLLSNVIDELRQDLKIYCLRADSKPHYINKQNELIEKLTKCYNKTYIEKADLWIFTNNEIISLRERDSRISNFYIELFGNQDGSYGMIKANLNNYE